MFRRVVLPLALLLGVAPGVVTRASAQERVELIPIDFTAAILNITVPAVRVADFEQFPVPPVLERQRTSSALLKSLYASTVVVQALDFHSTLRAFEAGAGEGNPLMSGIVRNRAAFAAAKAAVAASTILAVRQIAKRSKVGAVITMVAVNSAYAMVVRHNYNLARGR